MDHVSLNAQINVPFGVYQTFPTVFRADIYNGGDVFIALEQDHRWAIKDISLMASNRSSTLDAINHGIQFIAVTRGNQGAMMTMNTGMNSIIAALFYSLNYVNNPTVSDCHIRGNSHITFFDRFPIFEAREQLTVYMNIIGLSPTTGDMFGVVNIAYELLN